jgi:hypothetical protein
MISAPSSIFKFSLWSFVAGAAALSLSCSGAETPEGAGGTGGTTGGGAGTGAGGAGAGAGGAGAGGMVATGGMPPIMTGPLPDVGCDYTTIINKSCAIAGCHRSLEKAGGLIMTVEPALRDRLVNVPSKHIQIDCDPGPLYTECIPPPAACPTGDKLIDTAVPANSWTLKKLDGGANCGDAMPFAPGDDPMTGWGPDAKICLQNFFNALAAGK